MTLAEVTEITGRAGDFTVTVREHPRYVDRKRCIACGRCAAVCPATVTRQDGDTPGHRAIHIPYAQAVPLAYRIDARACIRLGDGRERCGACAGACPAGAIDFDDRERRHTIGVGAVILAPGLACFDPGGTEMYGYGRYANVITGLRMERLLAASGPATGRLARPGGGRVRRMAFLQCVGSRDENLCGHGYCSSVCCMYAIKQALVALGRDPELQVSIFYTDMRTHGKGFEEYYRRARDTPGVRFIRCRINGVEPLDSDGALRLRYVSEQGRQVEESFDLVVLAVGLETPDHVLALARRAGIRLTRHNFAAVSDFAPASTSRAGIFACGSFTGPKDIPGSVLEGSAAAAAAAGLLARARHTRTRRKTFPAQRDTSGETPRIGVFVCHCGTNIADHVDVEYLGDHAAALPGVVHVEQNLFSCSQDALEQMVRVIREKRLNRVVVAACTPRTHEPLFRETLQAAGLNGHLLAMANIRNQDAWVHGNNREAATRKAEDLTRMAVAGVTLQAPVREVTVPVVRRALVIGGGLAGMAAAVSLADQGFPVDLVERTAVLGGNARHLHRTWSGEQIAPRLEALVNQVRSHPEITVHLESEVVAAQGYVGNFSSTIRTDRGRTRTIAHGATIIATGATRLLPDEYGYHQHREVVSALEFDKLLEIGDSLVRKSTSFVFIQCVGSRQPDRNYCSRVCCTHAVQSAIHLKKENPGREIYILYRDMRTYGQREPLYRKARELGIVFISYDLHTPPGVEKREDGLEVQIQDHVLHRPLRIRADMLILAAAIIPPAGVRKLAGIYRLPLDSHGFFLEAHAKLRPVDCAENGVFVAGMALYPKPVEESIAQALAAAARAATLLATDSLVLDNLLAEVDPVRCDGCALCIDVCPYRAITLVEETDARGRMQQRIVVSSTRCRGCGLCQGTCPKRGIAVPGFSPEQLEHQLAAALAT